jgi:hypothetical protein
VVEADPLGLSSVNHEVIRRDGSLASTPLWLAWIPTEGGAANATVRQVIDSPDESPAERYLRK